MFVQKFNQNKNSEIYLLTIKLCIQINKIIILYIKYVYYNLLNLYLKKNCRLSLFFYLNYLQIYFMKT